jgi:hypothetical protein
VAVGVGRGVWVGTGDGVIVGIGVTEVVVVLNVMYMA